MTGDQKHTDHIATRQHLNRHADQRYVFYFFPHHTFLKTILANRTNGTFGFAPTHEANASQNQKSRFFAHAQKVSELNTQLTLKVEVL